MKLKEYLKDIVSPSDTSSSRKFVTLIVSFHFILTSFAATFFVFYVKIMTTKGSTDTDLLNSLNDILKYDFYIILAGLGFITGSDLVRVMIHGKPSAIFQNTTTEGDIKTQLNSGEDGVVEDNDTTQVVTIPKIDKNLNYD